MSYLKKKYYEYRAYLRSWTKLAVRKLFFPTNIMINNLIFCVISDSEHWGEKYSNKTKPTILPIESENKTSHKINLIWKKLKNYTFELIIIDSFCLITCLFNFILSAIIL